MAHLQHGDHLPFPSYADADGDGFGDPLAESIGCVAPEGTVANADDCDDSADFVSPDGEDTCGNGVDEDCSGDDALCSVESGGWVLTAGRIERGPQPGTIYGSYTFEDLEVVEGVVETRGGGASLLADLFTNDPVWSQYACTVDADCASVPRPTGGYVYCTAPDGSGEPKRCWTRPGDFVSRSRFRVPGEYLTPATGSYTPTADQPTTPESETLVPAPGDAGQGGVPVRWMVLSCMAAAGIPAGCAMVDDPTTHVYSAGPVFVWTPE